MGEPIVWSSLAGQRPTSPWLWNKPFDMLVMGGASSLIFGAVAVVGSVASLRTGEWLIIAFMHLGIAVNYPHYAATYQLIVRERVKQPRNYRILVASLPFVIGIALVVAHFPGVLLVLLLRLYLTWSPYHYAKQHFGLSSMYSARAGRAMDAVEKRLLVSAFVLQAFFMMLTLNASYLDPSAQGTASLVLHPILPSWVYAPALVCVGASFVMYAAAATRHKRRTGHHLMSMVPLLFVVSFAWMVLPNIWIPGQGSGPWVGPRIAAWLPVAVPFFHCLQYLGVASHRERMSGPVRPVLLMAGLMVLGYAMFEVTAVALHVGAGLQQDYALFLMASLINVHHFWLDGIVWRAPTKAPVPRTAVMV
jgi:hypothetical protein